MEWHQALDFFGEKPQEKDLSAGTSAPASTKVQRRKAPVEEELDLHGLTVQEAERALDAFLVSARKRGVKKVRIVHGRGLHSTAGPVLKDRARDWASRQKGLKWEPCPAAEWGPGAFWIWIGP